jgi:hypothetical protein
VAGVVIVPNAAAGKQFLSRSGSVVGEPSEFGGDNFTMSEYRSTSQLTKPAPDDES